MLYSCSGVLMDFSMLLGCSEGFQHVICCFRIFLSCLAHCNVIFRVFWLFLACLAYCYAVVFRGGFSMINSYTVRLFWGVFIMFSLLLYCCQGVLMGFLVWLTHCVLMAFTCLTLFNYVWVSLTQYYVVVRVFWVAARWLLNSPSQSSPPSDFLYSGL